MDNFKFGIWRPSKGKMKISYLEHYKGVWDGKWECDLSFTIVMWIECNYVLCFNRARINTDDIAVMQIGEVEKKHAQKKN